MEMNKDLINKIMELFNLKINNIMQLNSVWWKGLKQI